MKSEIDTQLVSDMVEDVLGLIEGGSSFDDAMTVSARRFNESKRWGPTSDEVNEVHRLVKLRTEHKLVPAPTFAVPGGPGWKEPGS